MPRAHFADRLRNRDPLEGAWSLLGEPVAAEVVAAQGFDFVVVDGEHSENTIGDVGDLVRAVDAAGTATVPVVRVPSADRAAIRRFLDLGPAGVVVPQIESAEEAREAVAASRFPPDGVRGIAGSRASDYGRDLVDYVASANRRVATILQIETRGALDDLEEIVAIDGLDALFVGPADLSARLGEFGDFDGDRFQSALERIVTVADDAGVPVGTLATDSDHVATRLNDWQMDFLVTGTDIGYLQAGMAAYREAFADAR